MVIWVVKFSRGRNTKLEGDSQNLRLINVRFPTHSSHFVGNYMNIFHKTEVQTGRALSPRPRKKRTARAACF